MSSFKKIVLPIVLGLLLVFIQYHLVKVNLKTSKAKFNNLVHIGLLNLSDELENSFYCYRSKAQQTIAKDENFFLLKPVTDSLKGDNKNQKIILDTLLSHSLDDKFSFSRYHFGTDTRINLTMDFEFLPLNKNVDDTLLNGSELYTKNLYKNSIFNIDGERLLDTLILDSLIKKHIISIEGAENTKYKVYQGKNTVYSNLDSKKRHVFKQKFQLYQSEFFPKLNLQLHFLNPEKQILSSQIYFIIATFGLSCILVILLIRNIQFLSAQKKLNEQKTEFIHLMTHEFNTPVTNLGLVTKKFSPNLSSDKLDQLMNIVSVETDRIKRNIKTLFDINKLSLNELQLEMKANSIHELILLSLELFELTFIEENIVIKQNLNAEIDLVNCDRNHMLNVFTNIIENSVKYRSKDASISIETNFSNNEITLKISDNGLGMKKAQTKKVFDKYYQSKEPNNKPVEGMGLGLYYSKKIIEFHNGFIGLNSENNLGTEVTITLPTIKQDA